MDFVTGLPRTPTSKDAIWEIVDRLTRSTHFLAIRVDFSLERLARLHGAPVSIVSDRDRRFVSQFWESMHKAMGTNLKFSTAFQPQTDGLSERTIQTLEDMLRAYVIYFKGSWDEHLLWWSLHIIKTTKQVLKKHHMRLCMVGSVGLLYVGMILEKEDCWVLRLYSKQ